MATASPRLSVLTTLVLTASSSDRVHAQTTDQTRPSPSETRILEQTLGIQSPLARHRAADLLAARTATTLDAWLDALRNWRPAHPLESGDHALTVELWNGQATESTKLHVYVPAAKPPTEGYPLLHAAHGTGGSGRSSSNMWARIAEQLELVIVAPSESGENVGYRFDPRERNIARSAIRWTKTRLAIDSNRIYLSGVSRGGHLTWDLALREPDLAAAIAPMIGGPRWNPDGQNNMRFLENVVHLPIRDLQGSGDDPGLLFNLHIAFDELERFGAQDAKLIEFAELGHSFRLDAVDWSTFWAKRRTPHPTRITRIAATPGEGRAFWFEILEVDRKKVHERFRPSMPSSVANRLGDAGQRRWIHKRAVKFSARAEATHTGPGKFQIRSRHIKSFRLLLDDELLGTATKVTVQHGGRRPSRKVERSTRVLLREFVDRVDSSFLPVFLPEF